MKTTQERFINLGGKFEVGIHYTHLIYNNHKMKIPNEYFLSTDPERIDVLHYYLDIIPKIYNNEGGSGVIAYPEDFDSLFKHATFCTKDCVSSEDLCKLLKPTTGEKV